MHFHDMIFLALAAGIIVLMLIPRAIMGLRSSRRDALRDRTRVAAKGREDKRADPKDALPQDAQS